VACLKDLFDLLYLKYRGNILFVTPMEMVDAEHLRLYDDIAAGNLDGARHVLAHHIANVKHHAISSIERMKHEKIVKI
jgi:DNA-binding GntR family transcriptional regulator